MIYQCPLTIYFREISSPSMFPEAYTSCTFLKWDEIKKIGMIPKLEILKLQCEALGGGQWETNDGGFCRLKYLAFKFIKSCSMERLQ